METTKQLLEVNAENINKALQSIKEYANKKDYVITGNPHSELNLDFPSQKAKKRFRNSLNRVVKHTTMKSANLFLHYLAKYSNSTLKLEYSAKEKAIIEKRNKWKEAKAIAAQLMAEYKLEKGDYYKTFKQS